MDSVEGDPGEGRSALVDVTVLSLPALLTSGDSVLDKALRRVLSELDDHLDISATFGNSVGLTD